MLALLASCFQCTDLQGQTQEKWEFPKSSLCSNHRFRSSVLARPWTQQNLLVRALKRRQAEHQALSSLYLLSWSWLYKSHYGWLFNACADNYIVQIFVCPQDEGLTRLFWLQVKQLKSLPINYVDSTVFKWPLCFYCAFSVFD